MAEFNSERSWLKLFMLDLFTFAALSFVQLFLLHDVFYKLLFFIIHGNQFNWNQIADVVQSNPLVHWFTRKRTNTSLII